MIAVAAITAVTMHMSNCKYYCDRELEACRCRHGLVAGEVHG